MKHVPTPRHSVVSKIESGVWKENDISTPTTRHVNYSKCKIGITRAMCIDGSKFESVVKISVKIYWNVTGDAGQLVSSCVWRASPTDKHYISTLNSLEITIKPENERNAAMQKIEYMLECGLDSCTSGVRAIYHVLQKQYLACIKSWMRGIDRSWLEQGRVRKCYV